MDELNEDAPEVLETPETEAEEVETPEAPAEPEETIEQLKARLAETEAKNKQLFERAKKAEAKPAEGAPQLSIADIHALRDVHEDDVERVEKFAKSEGVSIKEALKSDELKAILTVRSEKRSSASAANISNVRRGPSKATGDTLLEQARSGKISDDDADIERIVEARSKQK